MTNNILVLICCILFVQNSWSQIVSGKITYKVEADESMMSAILNDDKVATEVNDYLKVMFRNQVKTLPFLEYHLEFNQKESIFKKIESMTSDSGFDLNKTAKNIGVNGVYYTDLEEGESYHQENTWGQDITIKHSINELDWEITNETKTIQGYECYKATVEFIPDFGKGEVATAWFTKDLPFQFGPAFYSGLPGVILEVKQGYYTFYADNIKLTKREVKIKKPKMKNIIKYDNFKEEMEQMKRNFIQAQ